MIHIKELRFGNKVQTRQGEIITVQQILYSTIIYEMQMEVEVSGPINGKRSRKASNYSAQLSEVVKEIDCQELYPIILTPKILRKCGFRNFLREEWIIRIDNSHIDFQLLNDGLRLGRTGPSLTNFKYLHQLQNLIFAMSAQELEIENLTDLNGHDFQG